MTNTNTNLTEISGFKGYYTDGEIFISRRGVEFQLNINKDNRVYMIKDGMKKSKAYDVQEVLKNMKTQKDTKISVVLTSKAACKLFNCSAVMLAYNAKKGKGVKKLARNQYVLCDAPQRPEGCFSGSEICEKLGISPALLKYRSDNKLGVVKLARNQYEILAANPEGKTANELATQYGVTVASIYNYVKLGKAKKVGMKKYVMTCTL